MCYKAGAGEKIGISHSTLQNERVENVFKNLFFLPHDSTGFYEGLRGVICFLLILSSLISLSHSYTFIQISIPPVTMWCVHACVFLYIYHTNKQTHITILPSHIPHLCICVSGVERFAPYCNSEGRPAASWPVLNRLASVH